MALFLDTVRGAKAWLPLVDSRLRADSIVMDKWRQQLSAGLNQCVPFVVSNVAAYFYQGTEQEVWDLFSDFPKTVPPFEWTWLEWNIPDRVNSEGKDQFLDISALARRAGALVTWAKVDSAEYIKNPEAIYKMNVIPFLDGPYSCPFVMATCAFGLSKSYDPVTVHPGTDNLMYVLNGIDQSKVRTDGDREDMRALTTQACVLSYPAMLALSMLNCRNVTTKVIAPSAALCRKHQKRGHEPPRSYRTIEIQPMTQRIKSATGSAGYSKSAVAIIRGHFKDYRDGGGLFGKVHGLFWWDQQLHGNPLGANYAMRHNARPLDPRWAAQQAAAKH